MKNLLLLLIFYFSINRVVFSQWTKIYGENSVSEYSRDLIDLEDGYAILAHEWNSTWLIRTDLMGDTLWTKKYSGYDLTKIIKNNDSGFYIFNDIEYSNSKTIKIIKTDLIGNIIWGQEFKKGREIKPVTDNSFLVLTRPSDFSFELQMLNESGVVSWRKQYSIENNYAWYASNIFISNKMNIFVSIASYFPSNLLTIFNTNLSGDSLWFNSFDSIRATSIYMNQGRTGEYFIAGNSNRYETGFDDRSYVLKIDTLGNKIETIFNSRSHGKLFSTNDSNFIKILNEDSIIVKSDKEHNIIWEKDYTLFLNQPYDPLIRCITENDSYILTDNDREIGPLLIKIDSEGEFIWQKSLKQDSLKSILGSSVIPLNDSIFVLSGSAAFHGNTYKIDILIEEIHSPSKVKLFYFPHEPKDLESSTEDILFSDSIDVKIISNIFNSDIYYTLDCSEPTNQSNHYSQPIRIDSNTIIKAIGIAAGYENSEISSMEYNFFQKLNVELQNNYVGVDSNFSGSANVKIDIPAPTASIGEISSLKWLFNNKIIGEGNNLSFDFPIGTNNLILETIGTWGTVQYDTTEVSVYSSQYSRVNSDYDFSINKYITPASQLKNGYFVLSSFDFDLYQYKAAIVDSTFNLSWINSLRNLYSTPCVINENNILFANLFSSIGDISLFSDSLSSNFSNSGVIQVSEHLINSPSYSSDSLAIIGTISGKVIATNISNLDEKLWEFQCGDTISSHIVINKKNDLIFGCKDNNLYSLSSAGNLNWKFSVDASIESTPALGTDSSIVFGANNGFLYKITQAGKELWKFQTNGNIKSSPVIDYYGNIYFGSSDGNFYAINSNGELNWKYETKSKKECFASIGRNGLIYVNAEPNLLNVFNKSGKIIWYFEFKQKPPAKDNLGRDIIEALFNAPLVTDNNLVLIRTNFDQFYLFKDNIIPDSLEYLPPQWPTFKGSNQRTGMSYSDQVTLVKDKLKNIVVDYKLEQNYPNPFNPTTTIQYSIPVVKSSKLSQQPIVRLKVYDLLGKEIAILVDKRQKSGNYEIKFDASSLPSGIYFYRIQSGSFSKTKKLILLK